MGHRHFYKPFVAAFCTLSLLSACNTNSTQAPPQHENTYQNPVSASFADTFADPAIIEGLDGWYYTYATSDPLKAGEPSGAGHIARTKDFSHWEYVGTIFDESNWPSWATSTAGLWAPDIRYIGGKYVLYFTVTDTTLNPEKWDPAIGVATADHPSGPWRPTSEPVIPPKKLPNGKFVNTIDPAGFTATNGKHYLYWGNYFGGVHATELDASGTKIVGESKLIGAWDRYEGPYVIHRGGWYYLMASSANCCAGPSTGYSVFVGRSKSPMGPFVDKDGLDMAASVTGGSILLTQNGNTWIGAGHHAVTTDASGRNWIVYHALDRNKPWLTEPGGINRRPMLIDPITWHDGWPKVRGGAGPSVGSQVPPQTGSMLKGDPARPSTVVTRCKKSEDKQAGETCTIAKSANISTPKNLKHYRLTLDIKPENKPIVLKVDKDWKIVIDPTHREVTLQTPHETKKGTLLSRGGWNRLTVERQQKTVLLELAESNLMSPFVHLLAGAPATTPQEAAIDISGPASLDNVKLIKPTSPTDPGAPNPEPSKLVWTDDFDKDLDKRWTWVRQPRDAKMENGSLSWKLEKADLPGERNNQPLLLTEAPNSDWIIETRFTLDLGENSVRNFQQAGLIAYVDDDYFVRLSSVAIHKTRTVEFGKEGPIAGEGSNPIWGGAIVGAPTPTMHMRLAHHLNQQGEHLYRSAISRDGGKTWIWGATWTLKSKHNPKVGLHAGGGDTPPTSVKFDWVKFMDASWPDN